MKKIILFISLPVLLALLNVLFYFLLEPPKTKKELESVYSFLPGKMLAIIDHHFMQRRLLEKTEQGYRVQEFYGPYPTTTPFIIKNKEDLTKNIGYSETDTGERFDTINVEGEITLYHQTKIIPWVRYGGSTGFERLESYLGFQKLKLWDKPYQQTFPIKRQLNYQAGKRQGQQIAYYQNDQRANVANYQNGVLEGTSSSWNDEGNKLLEINFKNGLLEGTYTNWSPEGKLFVSGTYQADQKQGAWTYWLADGRQQRIQFYHQGKLLDTVIINRNDTTKRMPPEDRVKCGLFNNKLIKIHVSDGALYSSSEDHKKQEDCSRQIDSLSIHSKVDNSTMDLFFTLQKNPYDLYKLREETFTSIFKDKAFEKTKDPVTGLWTTRQTADTINSRYYWLEENGQLTDFIVCSSSGESCSGYTNLAEYDAGFKMESRSNSFLPQWFFMQEQSKAFMRTHTINNEQ